MAELRFCQMKYRHLLSVSLVVAIVCVLAGCGDATTTVDSEDGSGGAASDTPPSVVHSATGIFNSLDRAAHTINLSHEAVPSAQWPAMTMDFHISDDLEIGDLDPGQHVAFEFTTDNNVTKIQPVP